MGFLLKKTIGALISPYPLVALFFISGFVLLFIPCKKNHIKYLLGTGIFLFLLFGYPVFPNALISQLETRHPPFTGFKNDFSDTVCFVSVLGGGHNDNENFPPTASMGASSAARICEGIRIYRQQPQCRLIFSGAAIYTKESEAWCAGEFAKSLGVPARDIVLLESPKDTEEEAMAIKTIVNTAPFALVTSASHMPRAILLLRKQGMNPIPAPTDYRATKKLKLSPANFFPEANNFKKVEIAVHEYLGLVWSKIRGRI